MVRSACPFFSPPGRRVNVGRRAKSGAKKLVEHYGEWLVRVRYHTTKRTARSPPFQRNSGGGVKNGNETD
jgi:hypothetical protein